MHTACKGNININSLLLTLVTVRVYAKKQAANRLLKEKASWVQSDTDTGQSELPV